MKLVRNLKTEVVHLSGCNSRGDNARPWTYATTRTLDEITEDTAQYPWLHLCRSCLHGYCHCQKCAKAGAAGG